MNSFVTFFLSFGHFDVIVPFMILSCLWAGRERPYTLLYLMALSMILNVALKVSFQIPLSPALGKAGFAFPSGHMQLATVFYLSMIHRIQSKLILGITVGLLTGLGWALIQAGYHNLYDVIGGVVVGYLLVYFYNLSVAKWPDRIKSTALILTTLLIGYIYYRQGFVPNHALFAYLLILFDRSIAYCFLAYQSLNKIRS